MVDFVYGFLCLQLKGTFQIWTHTLYSKMLAFPETVNISNEKNWSLHVFALFCIAFGMAPSTDGRFINIIEGWWHRGLFSTSTWGVDRLWATNILWMCFISQIIWTKMISATDSSIITYQTHSEWPSPKRMPFSRLRLLFQGEWNPCWSDTVKVEIKDTEKLFWGKQKLSVNNAVWIIHQFHGYTPPDSGIVRF